MSTSIDARKAWVYLETEGPLEIVGPSVIELGSLSEGDSRERTVRVRFTGEGRAELYGGIRIEPRDSSWLSLNEGSDVLYSRDYASFLVSPGKTFFAKTFYDAQVDSINDAFGVPESVDGVSTQSVNPVRRRAYREALRKLSISRGETTLGRRDSAKKNAEVNSGAANAAASSIVISGSVKYEDRNGVDLPVRGAVVKIMDEDVVFDDELATTTTDDAGNYSATVDGAFFESEVDLYVRVLAQSGSANVIDRNGETIEVRSDTLANLTPSTNRPIHIVASNSTGAGKALSIHDALVMSSRYLTGLTGSAAQQVDVTYPSPNGGSYFTGGSLYIDQNDPFEWDVVHHEYGHYVGNLYNLDNSPGGCHVLGTNLSEDPQRCPNRPVAYYTKDEGTRLAWGEAWPTYFAISLQQARNAASFGIPNVGDLFYTDGGINYSIESNGARGTGEDNEVAVQQILWDLYDGNADSGDRVALGDVALWSKLTQSTPTRLGDFWSAISQGAPVEQALTNGEIFAEHGVAPAPTAPAAGTLVPSTGDVVFEWEANGGGSSANSPYRNDEFVFEIYSPDLTTVLYTRAGITQPTLTIPAEELNEQVFGDNPVGQDVKRAKWFVRGKNTASPATPQSGYYTGPARLLKGSGDNAAVAYVLDRSGSMRGSALTYAKAAASQGITTLETGDEVGVVSFSSGGRADFPLTKITQGGGVRAGARQSVSSLSAGGGTSIGAGLNVAYNMLRGSNAKQLDYVLLSDGQDGTPTYTQEVVARIRGLITPASPQIASASDGSSLGRLASASGPSASDPYASGPPSAPSANAEGGTGAVSRIYSIAYGAGADQQLLSDLAAQTGGLFLYAPSRNDPLALGNLFSAIQGRISGEQRLGSFESALSAPAEAEQAFSVTSDVSEETVTLLWDRPTDSLHLELERPDGSVITPNSADGDLDVEQVAGPGVHYYTLVAPQEGEWTARVRAVATSGTARYALTLTAQSSVTLDAAFERSRYYTGQPIAVTAQLTEDGLPLTGATVEVDVDAPTDRQSLTVQRVEDQKKAAAAGRAARGEEQTLMASPVGGGSDEAKMQAEAGTLELFDDGAHGDGAAGDGVYGAFFRETSGAGSYTFRFSAAGTSESGASFARQATRSVFVAPASQEAPVLLSPANGEADVVLPPALTWSSVDEAVSYRVQVSTSLSFSSPLWDELVTDTSYVVEDLALSAAYYWRVRARRESGSVGDWSLPYAFTTTADAAPPEIAVAEDAVLWPPNHRYVSFEIEDMVTEVIDEVAGPIPTDSVRITTVWSDEPENGRGDGNTVDDIVIAEDARSVQLRSERQGGGNGRVYTVTLAASDPSGNVGTATYQVRVPKSKKSDAVDDGPEAGYTVEAGDPNGPSFAGQLEESTVPEAFELGGAYPNPARSAATLPLSLAEAAHVRAEAYDVLGRRVSVLAEGALNAGRHHLQLQSRGLASGLYFVRVQLETSAGQRRVFTEKVTLVK